MTPIEAAYESAKGRLGGMSLSEFSEQTKGFEVAPLHYLGECKGAVLVKGKEVHVCVSPPWYGRQAVRIINRVISEHGEATSHATTDAGRKILEKLGFVADGDIYRSTKAWA